MKKIMVADVTLKKLSEDRAVSLLFREKSAIASCADKLGVDAVELPAVKNQREDAIIYKTVAKNMASATLALPVGFDAESVAFAYECVKEAKSPRLQVELPVSTLQMEYTYHVKQAKMLEKISALVEAARGLCEDVEFVALDATRADEAFLIAAAQEAEAKGASLVTVVDNAGVSTPAEIAALVRSVKAAVKIPVYVQVSDAVNMAVASAFAAIEAGVDGVKCAMVGKDALLAGALSDAMGACGAKVGAEISLNNTKIHASIDAMLASIRHESYDAADADEKTGVLLDGDSTIAQIADASALLGYDLSDEDLGAVEKALARVCEKKGSVGAKELEAIIASSAMQAPSTYHFESYTTTSSNVLSAMSQVTLKTEGETICGVSAGDGPIDSAFRAIEQCVGHHYELDDFQVQSVTEGKEALGSALVKLRYNGKLYSGNGTSTDIVAASIRAYINALNKIVFEEC